MNMCSSLDRMQNKPIRISTDLGERIHKWLSSTKFVLEMHSGDESSDDVENGEWSCSLAMND